LKRYKKIITIIIIIGMLIYAGPTLLGRAFGLNALVFKTDDMFPTIKIGDKVIIYKRAYAHKLPAINDVVALTLPADPDKIYIRRIKQENANNYYVSADNTSGKDSKEWGYIPTSNIIGEVVLIYTGYNCTYNKLSQS